MTLTIDDLLTALREGRTITGGSPLHEVMHQASQEALRIAGELNGAYRSPERVRELLAELTGRPVHKSVTLFPPFTADFGKNITLGRDVFINSGCRFQDQGGVTIGDDCLIGMNSTVLSHAVIGEGSLVAAGAVVLEGTVVPPGSLVAGVPAKVRRELTPDEQEAVRGNARVYLELSRAYAKR